MGIVYNDYNSSFKELLERDRSFAIHERNIQVKSGLSPVIMNDIFQLDKNSSYKLRSGNHLQRTNIQTVHFGSESIKKLGTRIWDLIPTEIKVSNILWFSRKRWTIGLLRAAFVAFAGSILAKLVS